MFGEAARSASLAERPRLSTLITSIGEHERNYSSEKLTSLIRVASALARYSKEVDPWLLVELQPRSAVWLRTLEEQVDTLPDGVLELALPLYQLFVPLEAAHRTERLREKAIRALMRMKAHDTELKILQQAPGADPKLMAECREGLGDLELAAADYLKAGSPHDALRCYRLIPDFDKSLQLLESVGKDPARDSLLWLRLLPAEKKFLEEVLQTALGVSRKKPAVKRTKTAVKKPAPRRKDAL